MARDLRDFVLLYLASTHRIPGAPNRRPSGARQNEMVLREVRGCRRGLPQAVHVRSEILAESRVL